MRTKLLLLFFALGEITASAQTDSLPNITKTSNGKLIDPIQIHEVVVTGTRNETDIRHLPMTISVIDRKQIEQSMQPSILPILTQQVPGLFITARGIMGYGVSGGAAGGMSLRGIGSGSGRLMVLIDGHPQYMGLMGHPIADAYQSLMAERVEVLRGPASVLYGSNAMGGVINIVTRQLHEEGVKTNLNLGYGSFNTLQSEVTNRIRKGGFTRGMTSVAVENRYERTSGAVSFFYNWGDHWINDGYTANPDDKNNPKPYRFDSHDDMMGISWYQSAQLFTGNRLTAGVDYYRFGGKAQNRYVEGERNGEREHIVDKVQHEIAGYIDFRQDISHWLTLDAGIRIDHHSHIGTEWIPQAGLSFHLPGSIELKASAGKGFRYPTIREMYMFPPKNPDLRPESMWNYELAFAQRLRDGRLSYGINVFYIDGKNLIVAVPRAGATPLNMNTGKIDNTGVEAEAAYRIHPHWSVETNYSYLHMDNPVLGAPEHKFYAGAMFSKNRWTVSTGLQYVANLYTDVDHVQTEDFVLWNINGSFKVTEWFDIWARGENLLAQRYEINAGYPMPKATIMAGINVKF